MDQKKTNENHSKPKLKNRTFIFTLLVLLISVIGITSAFLATRTDAVENIFAPSKVTVEVVEEFDGDIKSKVNVKNTGDTAAYVRVNLVTYRVNDDGVRIGGNAVIPTFTPGSNWYLIKGHYYYSIPVNPGAMPVTNLIDSMTLVGNYTDVDGGKQVIEVMAEGIQSVPLQAIQEAWSVTISGNQVIEFTGN